MFTNYVRNAWKLQIQNQTLVSERFLDDYIFISERMVKNSYIKSLLERLVSEIFLLDEKKKFLYKKSCR